MTQLIEIKTCTALWSVDGVPLRLQRRKSINDRLTQQTIERYREFLQGEAYKSSPQVLCEIAGILTDNSIVRIGMAVYQEQFLKMFEHYARLYVKEWEQSEKCFCSNKVSMFPVFEFMFRNRLVGQPESPLTILKAVACDNKIFLDIFEKCFSAFWADKISERIDKQEDLSAIREKIGIQSTTEYLSLLPEQKVREYLCAISGKFTDERRLITTQSFCKEVLGNDISVSSPRFHPGFASLAAETVKQEFALQCRKFIAENHLELTMSSDKWKLFRKHGPSLCWDTVDFTGIQSPSLRLEIKYFMKHRYYIITANKDRSITTLTYAANLLTENNPGIHFLQMWTMWMSVPFI